ncbi:hypothetical protein GPJ56_005642 [Histomonas meleagridis]|uniref:uncharacterized protein n=1 Tax=Histomonas meleagridis TaxID=135588 RepID=UPI00355A4F0A|nr:hypothetical protein GPJ56_005642 [Histomonas meleagridis]KAH0803423.1 hypothetical protein GO595_003767 [Histomonas meleagridis]
MRTPINQLHDISTQEIFNKLAAVGTFQTRLHFEMGDEDVITESDSNNICHNINFIPSIPDIPTGAAVRLFQNLRFKWLQNNIIFINKFIFSINGKSAKIKAKRTVSPNGDGTTSRSTVTISILETDLNEDVTNKLFNYITSRVKKENDLLSLSQGTKIMIQNNFSLPFEKVFSDVRNYISELDHLLEEDSSVDVSILDAVSELQLLLTEVNSSSNKIMSALRRRDELQQQIKEQSKEITEAANEIENALSHPKRIIKAPDKKNDIAFVFALIPLSVALISYALRKK